MTPVRYGVVGLRGFGATHVRSALQLPGVTLTAVADVDAAAVHAQAQALGVRGFTDHHALLAAGVVDAVSLVVPHALHAPLTLDCLAAGVHVLVEKPIAIRVSEADRMIAAARAHGRVLAVGHQYRTHRTPRTMKALIDAGAIGRPLRALWSWGVYRPEAYYARGPWYATWEDAGGGALWHVSHDLDLMCWMLGDPVRVTALLGTQLHATAVDDIVCASIAFAGGALAVLQATLNQPRAHSVRQIAGDAGIVVVPDVQSLTFDVRDRVLLGTYPDTLGNLARTLTGPRQEPPIRWRRVPLVGDEPLWARWLRPRKLWLRTGLVKGRPHGTTRLMATFVRAIREGGEPLVTAESARRTLELVNAIVLSAVRGRAVDLPLDPAEYDDVWADLCAGRVRLPGAPAPATAQAIV